MNREKLSVTIITLNEEENIRDCLESVRWADEIVVVDSGSSDRTVEICREYTDRVFVNSWPGYKEQKNFALDKASHLWIFSIDADERVPGALRDFILEELEHPGHDGYCFPRQNYFLGKFMKHGGWYPDHVMRFFRRDRGAFEGNRLHEKVLITSGKVRTVSLPLRHYTYRTMSDYVLRQNRYTSISAAEKAGGAGSAIGALLIIPLRVTVKFIETYIVKKGFLDGAQGFLAAMGASCSIFVRQVKIWELKRGSG